MRTICGILALLFIVSCGRVSLHHDLSEPEADKILVLLDKNGIPAAKEKSVKGQEVSWTVVVPGSDIVNARRLLVDSNLPSKPELGLSGVYKEKGLIPTPDEQRARFLLALKGEITNALQKIPGVTEVGVVLNVPKEKELSLGNEEEVYPSASIVLRVGDPTLLESTLTEEKVKRFVANSIPNMRTSDVIVIISSEGAGGPSPTDLRRPSAVPPSITPPPVAGEVPEVSVTTVEEEGGDMIEVGGILIDPDSLGRIKFYLVLFLIVLILLSSALLIMIFRFRGLKGRSGPKRLKALPLKDGGGGGLLSRGGKTPGGIPGKGETGTGR